MLRQCARRPVPSAMARRAVIDFAGSFRLPLAPAAVWDLVAEPANFATWWSWLSDLRVEGDGLAPGATWHGVVSPPVPWRLSLEVTFLACERPWSADALVSGDCSGPASLRLAGLDDGTEATLAWSLEMHPLALRVADRVARPLLLAGHDAVVRWALAGFSAALAQRAGPAAT